MKRETPEERAAGSARTRRQVFPQGVLQLRLPAHRRRARRGRPAYVLLATPHPYHGTASAARCSPRWKANFGSTNRTTVGSGRRRSNAVVLDGIIRGAHASAGAHIILEQTVSVRASGAETPQLRSAQDPPPERVSN